MGFWNNVCAFALSLLAQSPLSLFEQESLTTSSPYYDDHTSHHSNELELFDFNNLPSFPINTQGVPNAYNSEFITANYCNGPSSRDKWCNHTTIKTDYDRVELVPSTGITRYITLVVTSKNEFCGDGYCRDTMLVNGTYPGPLIRGNWGDWFEITVINQMTNCNGTSMHWHGIRQWNTVWEDGVAGVTQCPIAPGKSQKYRWRATQYGTSWYHSHFSLQYADGIAGPLVIDGPTSMNYTEDKGPLMLTDWYHDDAFSVYHVETTAQPPFNFSYTPSNLLNGVGRFTNVTRVTGGVEKVLYPACIPKQNDTICRPELASTYKTYITPSSGGADQRYYKYRIINMSTLTHFTFWIEGHDFWIVSTDFVPIQPIKRHYLNVAIGQRYDIIIEAKTLKNIKNNWKGNPNFWIKMRLCNELCYGDVCPDKPDGSPGDCVFVECRQGILSYDPNAGNPPLDSIPKKRRKEYPTPPSDLCKDPRRQDLQPIVQRNLNGLISKHMVFPDPFEVDRRAGTQDYKEVFGKKYGGEMDANDNEQSPPNDADLPHIWDFGHSRHPGNSKKSHVSFMIDWGNATLRLAAQNIPSNQWNPRFVPIVLDQPEKWAVFAIASNWTSELEHDKNIPGGAHPIHLHGHDFVILATGTTAFKYGQNYTLDLDNPARRDVVMLPQNGFVVIGFLQDNPGTWLMHCHIAWHASAGLALQWVERPGEIPALMNQFPEIMEQQNRLCEEWNDHTSKPCEWDPEKDPGMLAYQDDSGI